MNGLGWDPLNNASGCAVVSLRLHLVVEIFPRYSPTFYGDELVMPKDLILTIATTPTNGSLLAASYLYVAIGASCSLLVLLNRRYIPAPLYCHLWHHCGALSKRLLGTKTMLEACVQAMADVGE